MKHLLNDDCGERLYQSVLLRANLTTSFGISSKRQITGKHITFLDFCFGMFDQFLGSDSHTTKVGLVKQFIRIKV